MAGTIDETVEFLPIGIAVLTVSDSRTQANDASGDLLIGRVVAAGHRLVNRAIVIDDVGAIQAMVKTWCAAPDIDCIITTGGTGLTARDITPEAMRAMFDKEIEGFGELFRMLSFDKIGTSALQSRALAGVAMGVYIFCLPGAPSACRDGWDLILQYQLDIRHRPCNFAQIMPRLKTR